MTFPIWLRLLARNRFRISPACWPMACSITGFTCFNSVMGWYERFRYGRLIDVQRIDPPPIFIIGHWRTGTTLLHELMVNDEQFQSPTTYQCMAPHHFLVTQGVVTRWFGFVLPERRPMDNMLVGWERPQEDEFALCNLGVPSPYLSWAFPSEPPCFFEFLDLETVDQKSLLKWKRAMTGFLQRMMLSSSKRLILKSPTHTARVRVLLEMFPRAQFVHTVRDPYVVVPSFVRTWQRMGDVLGLQTRCREDLEDRLFELFDRMYGNFSRDRELLRDDQLCEVRYEDLASDPLAVVERIYGQLGLGHFDRAKGRIQAYVDRSRGYEANRHVLDDRLREKIARRWRPYLERYGY